MGSGGGSAPSSQTVTQTSEPPEYVKGPAQRFLSRAEGLSNQPYTTYQGERISPLNTLHNTALQQGQFAQNNLLPGAAAVMNNFAMGNYNSPAYIHPFVGPMLPNYTQPGYGGLSPTPHIGYAGKGGAMPGGTGTQPPGTGGQVPAPGPGGLTPTPIDPSSPYPQGTPAPATTPTPTGPTGDPFELVTLGPQGGYYNQGLFPGMQVPQWRADQLANLAMLEDQWNSRGGDGGDGSG